MQAKNQAGGRSGKLLVLGGQPSRFKQRNWHVRTSGFWLNHLYSQVWGYSPGRNGCASPFANPQNVSRADVFFWSWDWRRRYLKRWLYSATLGSSLVVLALLSTVGCKTTGRGSLEKRYSEARLQLQRGFANESLQLANAGLADSSRFPDLNWKFRILTAEGLIRQSHFAQALELLQPDPPSNSLPEIFWRRQLI